MKTFLLVSALLLVAGLTACGGDSPTAPTTTPTAPTGGGDTLMPTLSSIQTLVFNASCVDHHGENNVDGDLDLTDGMSYAELVNMPSFQVPALDLVEPSDAENSYLIHKLEGRAGIVGTQMPPAAQPLTTAQIDVIKQWITNGAQNN